MAKSVLLLTLVHPDFLPPVYAVAQVLRDEGYVVHVITFESLVPSDYDPGEDIIVTPVAKYHDQSFFQKTLIRQKFYAVVRKKIAERPSIVISFCAFSFLCAMKLRQNIPHAYIALEINNTPETFTESPLTYMRIRKVFSQVSNADLVATPSIERSAWLAGRCKLKNVPYTIQNTSYYQPCGNTNAYERLTGVLPEHFVGKTTVLYTGRINENYRVKEIVQAFNQLNDSSVVLIITGFRPGDRYCIDIAAMISELETKDNILLLPLVPREELIALQEHADIGICFMQEADGKLATQMAAPNKIGEYIANGLYLLTNNIVYTSQFNNTGIATLIDATTTDEIANGMKEALKRVSEEGFTDRIDAFYRDVFCMQKQLEPIIKLLKSPSRNEA